MIGQTFGEFTIEEILGSGGQASVYRARNHKGLEVAIKVVERSSGNMMQVVRFLREIAMSLRLKHAYITTVYAFGAKEGVLWMAMELVRGISLDKLLQSGELTMKEKVLLLGRISEIVYNAHARGIVHRDLKPANVMVDNSMRPRLLDFGISKPAPLNPENDVPFSAKACEGSSSTSTQIGGVLGSPPYMAPESWSGVSVDFKADLYAMGIIAYEMLAGRKPFHAQNAKEMMEHHLKSEVPYLQDFSPEVNAVIQKALAKNPVDRFDDVLSFFHALKNHLVFEDGTDPEVLIEDRLRDTEDLTSVVVTKTDMQDTPAASRISTVKERDKILTSAMALYMHLDQTLQKHIWQMEKETGHHYIRMQYQVEGMKQELGDMERAIGDVGSRVEEPEWKGERKTSEVGTVVSRA